MTRSLQFTLAVLLAPLAVAGLVSPSAAAQERLPTPAYCDSVCVTPGAEIPPQCRCGILGTGSSGGGAPAGEPPTAVEILNHVQAAYEARVAGVDNYTMVVQPQAAPMPVVAYYEKEIIDGTSMFRQLSPAELAERQAQEAGRPTPQDYGAGMEALAGALGGLNAPAGAPPGSQSALDLLTGGLRGLAGILQNAGPFETRQDLFNQLFEMEEFRERARHIGTETVNISICGGATPCGEASTTYSEEATAHILYADSLEDIDLGPGSEGYVLKEMWCWVFYEPALIIKTRAVLAQGDRLVAVQRTIHQHIRARSMLEPGYWEDAMATALDANPEWRLILPHAAHRMATIVHLLQLNEGPPTDDEMARLIGVALGGEN